MTHGPELDPEFDPDVFDESDDAEAPVPGSETPLLLKDVTWAMEVIKAERAEHVTDAPRPAGSRWIGNTSSNPLSGDFAYFACLKRLGYEVGLHMDAVDSNGIPLPGSLAVVTSKEDEPSVRAIGKALYECGPTPYAHFARAVALNTLRIRIDYVQCSGPAYKDHPNNLERGVHRVFPELDDADSGVTKAVAQGLYVRAAMTRVLESITSKLLAGRDPWGDQSSLMRLDYGTYERLRAEGVAPLGSEVYGLMARVVAEILARNPGIDPPYSKFL